MAWSTRRLWGIRANQLVRLRSRAKIVMSVFQPQKQLATDANAPEAIRVTPVRCWQGDSRSAKP